MFRSYVVIALRNLRRSKIYSVINILGLGIGFASVLMISMFILDEISFDGMHRNASNIYRVLRETRTDDGGVLGSTGSSGSLSYILGDHFPEVESVVRLTPARRTVLLVDGEPTTGRLSIVDSTFLSVFDFVLLQGDRRTALDEPSSLLITESKASAHFSGQSPVGTVVTLRDRYWGGRYTVTGVLADPPANSSIQFDFIAANPPDNGWSQGFFGRESWALDSPWRRVETYVQLRPDASVPQIEEKLLQWVSRHTEETFGLENAYHLQPLGDIHLSTPTHYRGATASINSGTPGYGDITHIRLFATIAILILIVACFNFVNLSTALSATRAKEVCLRKVVGAHRPQLIRQFLVESTSQALLAACLGVGLVQMLLPAFNNLTMKQLTFSQFSWISWSVIIILSGIVGILAGIYPGFVLTRPIPAVALPREEREATRINFRNLFVFAQFALCIVLVVGALVVRSQMALMTESRLGFETDQTLVLRFGMHEDARSRPGIASDLPAMATFKHEIESHPGVAESGAFANFIYHQRSRMVEVDGKEHELSFVSGEADFLRLMQFEFLAGNYDEWENVQVDEDGYPYRDQVLPAIINQTASKKFGWADPIGKTFRWRFPGTQTMINGQIIGMVRDFKNRSFREPIKPTIMIPKYKLAWLGIRLKGDRIPETMEYLQDRWKAYIPDYPFEFAFLDELVDGMYKAEQRTGILVDYFSGLAVFVGSLGLFGLAAFTSERRKKEIGIRKTLGASKASIFGLLSGPYIRIVVAANLVGVPLAYVIAEDWLSSFAYRIDLEPTYFLAGSGMILSIALLATVYHAVAAANRDPVRELRAE